MNQHAELENEGASLRSVLARVHWIRLLVGFVIAAGVGAGYATILRRSGDWNHGLPWERDLMLRLHQNFPTWLDDIMLTVPWLGSNILMLPATIIGAWRLWKPRRELALQIICAEAGSFALGFILKDMFARERPDLWQRRGQYDWAAYPSGHAISMIAVLFTFAHIYSRYKDVRWPYLVAALVLAVTLYSRLYLGLHWPSDLAGGYLIGFIWLTTTLLSFPQAPRQRPRD